MAFHCIAGIGRTGTMIALFLFHVWKKTNFLANQTLFNHKPKISMKEIIFFLKMQRARSITPYQFAKLLEYEEEFKKAPKKPNPIQFTPKVQKESNISLSQMKLSIGKLTNSKTVLSHSNLKNSQVKSHFGLKSKFKPMDPNMVQSTFLEPIKSKKSHDDNIALKTISAKSGFSRKKKDMNQRISHSAMFSPNKTVRVKSLKSKNVKFRSSHKHSSNFKTQKVSQFTPGKPANLHQTQPKKLFFEYKPRSNVHNNSKLNQKIPSKLQSKSSGKDKIYSERVPRINVFEIDQREKRGYRAKQFKQRKGSKLSQKFEKDFRLRKEREVKRKKNQKEEEEEDDMYGMTNEELEEQWIQNNKLKKTKKGVWDKFSNRFLSWF